MKRAAKLAAAGVAAFVILKLLAGIVLPLLGLAAGVVSLAVKLVLIVALGWLVLRVFRREKRSAA